MATKLIRYVATHDGHTFTRTSARIYTHAVICRKDPTDSWGSLGFCGSLELAHKLANTPRWRSLFSEIVVVPVSV